MSNPSTPDTPQSNDCFSNGLISAAQALDSLLDAASPVTDTEPVQTSIALGRVLAENLLSPVNVPPADNSAMDGYALASTDLKAGNPCLPSGQRICAGDTVSTLRPGSAARIFTGAPLPEGADAVVMQEQTRVKDGQVCFEAAVNPGENIRRAGEDIAINDEILVSGTRLRAQEMGLAASIGRAELSVFRKLRVAVFFTGDELIEPGNTLPPGKIYDSNRFTLHGLLTATGCEIIDLGIVADTLEDTRRALEKAASVADLVITSGGVSVGEEDHVRIALEQLGRLSMWRIAMKPGKPLAFGNVNGTPFIGLPGNPVSVFATFSLFAAPFVKKMQGMSSVRPRPVPAVAGFDWPRPGNREEYLRAKLVQQDGQHVLEIYPQQGSGVLTSTSWADGFAVIPIGQTIARGDAVNYLSFSDLL